MFIIKTVSWLGIHSFVSDKPLGKKGAMFTPSEDRAMQFSELCTAQIVRDNVLEEVQHANIWRI